VPGRDSGGAVQSLPAGRLTGGNHQAEAVADALAAAITTLPNQLAKTLTWDMGHELAQHQRFTIAVSASRGGTGDGSGTPGSSNRSSTSGGLSWKATITS
jgi:hypothetical protein